MVSQIRELPIGFMGFVAQDLELEFPELVLDQEDIIEGIEGVKTVMVGGQETTAILVKAIQEQNDLITNLQSQINDLRNN